MRVHGPTDADRHGTGETIYNAVVIAPNHILKLLPLLFTVLANQSRAAADTAPNEPATIDVVVGFVSEYCGACHGVPSPDLMPRKSWPKVIQAMVKLAAERTGGEYIPAEVVQHITAYYFGTSPEQLPLLPYVENTQDSLTFLKTEPGEKTGLPMVIDIVPVQLGENRGPELLVCDAESNRVLLLTKTGDVWQETVLADVQVPSRTEVVDYDQDGDRDIIVAALGLLPPSDELDGQVLILRQNDSGGFEKEVLLNGVGRVTDARAIDVDNDDDLDIVVAVFGGGTVGELAWLENTGAGEHVKHILLGVSGALNVSPIDLDADGRTDFVSLIAQEHESVVAFMNRGQGTFERVLLTQAPHPMYGFTGMELADVDSDGDADILISNGDALDTQPDPKPYHGVQWLENKGNLQFQFHEIGRFYGAATAVAGDVDGDGDTDVVAGSWLNFWDDPRRHSLVWFENDGQQRFTRQNILSRPTGIVSLALEDITGNDQLDIVAGVLRLDLVKKVLGGPGKETDATPTRPELPNTRIILLERAVPD